LLLVIDNIYRYYGFNNFDAFLVFASTVLLELLLLATAVATAALMLPMEIVVKFLTWTRVASN
jgi:hypothetical protein